MAPQRVAVAVVHTHVGLPPTALTAGQCAAAGELARELLSAQISRAHSITRQNTVR